MRAAIFRSGEIVVGTMPEPKPGAGQVLVKSLACGICGSDLHARKHAHRMVELSKFLPGRAPMDLSRDVVFGHEFCCEILDYGPDTTRKLKPGTRVCSLPAVLTPEGPKGIGYSNDYVGAYAEQMLLSEPLLLEVPNGLAAEHAALTEPLAVGVHAVAMANIRGGEVPLVIGCGPVGLAVIAALKIRGLGPIVAADYSPARRLLAEKMGADVVVDPATTQPYASWAEHAQMTEAEKAARPPMQALLPPLKPALIFECVGVPGVLQQLFEGAPRSARIVVVGVCMETDKSEPMLGIIKELNVQYVLGYTPEEFAYSLRLIAEGQVDAASLVTGRVGIDGVAQAFADLANPEAHTKILVEPWR
ncbi:zinc-binding dehydrogenase [Bradyrhizobium septentrionale]|uniref:Zinc-binding dehydrogenase n=1 Tax=Bradyrhizobium septentrionale TaxID=1404411 RepID=A0A973ZZ69_9BRAD|nr:zinc-binding dehydrogenase [Bradyrhizobium septentrionale]UGY12816.1 zinc-binding dehydrogenase [Bradyrhizobium septentrionale]UGY21363.1 zinc-binding dehydrogenase [Bradyrhizobium septentrionale]